MQSRFQIVVKKIIMENYDANIEYHLIIKTFLK